MAFLTKEASDLYGMYNMIHQDTSYQTKGVGVRFSSIIGAIW